MHGIVLKRLGHNVRILNRDPSNSLQSQGAGVSITQYVHEFFQKHDLSKLPLFLDSPYTKFIDREARVVEIRNVVMQMTSWSVLYWRLRANFDGLHSDLCPKLDEGETGAGKAIYDYGKTVTDVNYNEHDGLVTVQYDSIDGSNSFVQADLVIAADGPGSFVRRKLLPNVQRRYAGYIAWRGFAKESDISEETRQALGESLTYHLTGKGHMLVYANTEAPLKGLRRPQSITTNCSKILDPRRKNRQHCPRRTPPKLRLVRQLPRRLTYTRRHHDRQHRLPAPHHPPHG